MKHLMSSWLPALALCGTAHALDIENAREMDLDGLRGLGPATTRQILHERERTPFKDWADLQRRVRGLGPQTAARLSAQGLRVQGQAFGGASHAPAAAAGQGRP
jgi:competence protein ComEA